MTDCVLSARKGAVVTLTLNRPDRLNAMDFTTIARLHDLLDGVEVDETVRAIILTGAGDKAF